ncbi:Sugar (and other) transporter-like protein 41 [Elsinoe fawcettii]|nr:Sugar (and other) transporter-like protein 41 [Elsinoe fawcettii]
MQQWGGINIINYYLPVVFGSLGISRRMALILSGCNVINLLLSSAVGSLFIDRYGRVPLMLWGALAQAVCFAFVAAGLALGGYQWGAVAVTGVFLYFTVFGLTWIAVPWIYPAEVNTQRMRIAGASIATATNWICNYAVVLVTPVGVENLRWGYYVLLAALNVIFVPVVYFFYVETKNISLEQMDAIFEGKSGHKIETIAANRIGEKPAPDGIETEKVERAAIRAKP